MTEREAKEKRTKEIKLRLTPAEHQRLSTLAGDKALAEWIREFSLSAGQTDIFDHIEKKLAKRAAKRELERDRLTVDPELLRVLRGIGNNVNQIARRLNTVGKSESSIDFLTVAIELGHIRQALDDVRNACRGAADVS